MNTCSFRDRHQRKIDSYAFGRISTQKGERRLAVQRFMDRQLCGDL